MQIVNFISESFQEYEGEISLVLFCYNCNLACPKCYNYQEVTDKNMIIGNAIDIIESQLNPLHTAVVFLGGEPTTWHRKLFESVRYVKNKNLKVKIYSNGMIPEFIKYLCDEKLVDEFSIDYKAYTNVKKVIGANYTDEEYRKNVEKSISYIQKAKIPFEIRTTHWDNIDDWEKLIDYIKNKFLNIRHIIQEDFFKINQHQIKGV